MGAETCLWGWGLEHPWVLEHPSLGLGAVEHGEGAVGFPMTGEGVEGERSALTVATVTVVLCTVRS
jgi:hypothetical protein